MKVWAMLLTCLAVILLMPLSISATPSTTDVPIDKTWTITFSHPLVASSVTADTIYLTDSQQLKQDVKFVVHGKTVTIYAPTQGYAYNETYTLHIKGGIIGQVGQKTKTLSKPVTKTFTTVKPFAIVHPKADGTYDAVKTYATFDEANTNLQTQEAIVREGKYLKIPAGFAATNTKKVTTLYSKPTFTAEFEYAGIAKDSELVYVDATATYVKVQAAGQSMYVKHEDVTLIPSVAAKGQSYYSADSNGLWHRIYHHHSQKYDTPYLIGQKPSFLNTDVPYYSTDGTTFFDQDSQLIGESFAYFQYVSPRVPTSYSAAQLDALIANELAVKEKLGGTYTNATKNSPLIGLGVTLKKIETEQRLNALFILSLAIHESNYGMSCHAQNYHNLFGLNVTDSHDQCSATVDRKSPKYFETVALNINAFATRLNTNYLDPLLMKDFRYNGVALGNKMIGINVRYASDPYWGAKIAGHMYRLDRALGSSDYKVYPIGITTGANVSVHTKPGAHDNHVYQYKLDWTIKRLDYMPITLSTTPSTTNSWLQVVSELSTNATDLYTAAENVRIVSTH